MKIPIMLAVLLALAACSSDERLGYSRASGERAGLADSAGKAATGGQKSAQAARRYLALKHRVVLLVDAGALAQQFGAIQAECLKLGCEILSTGQESERRNAYANATLTARVPPAAFQGFFSAIQTHGKLLSHHSESEDKTAEVIDVEARIKNLEALKARVLELLAKNAGSLKDMLDAENQLAETQAELDSINGQRRALAMQTDMIRLEIELRPESARTQNSWTSPIAIAVDQAGEVLMQSIAFLLTATVALVPWALFLALIAIPIRRFWRRRRAAKLAKAQLEK